MTTQPLRSVLYVPGDNDRALNKVASLEADALILDLEDGVGPSGKADARENLLKFLDSRPKDKYVTVRANSLDSEWVAEDIRTFATTQPDALVFPKLESAEQVMRASALMDAAGYDKDVKLWGMIETPLGVVNSSQIGSAGGRLSSLVVGTSDLVKDLHARHTMGRIPILYSLSLVVLVARANNLSAIDGVHLDLDDGPGFVAACQQGTTMGFDGKTLIHPSQIKPSNEAFAPTQTDIAEAGKIIKAFEEASSRGKGVVLVDGKLVEALHIENAKRILALADKIFGDKN